MRRMIMSALLPVALASACSVPAAADPLQFTYSPSLSSQPVYVLQPQQQVPAPVPGQRYYVVVAPPQPTPRYAAPASAAQAYPAPARVVYTAPPPPPPPPPPASKGPGGGGFLEAIFGGPTIMAHVYQPAAQPAYQPVPEAAPTAAVPLAAPPAYASAASEADAAYPVDPKFNRQLVDYRGDQAPGTIIIDTPNKFLYLVEESGKALRYGIGVGRPGFTWAGIKTITGMREWPDWRPPPEMLARQPDLPRFMSGGVNNPLGARALYLGSTLYRIHGSNEPWTIGTNVSSGCIRMRNDDVTDLYNRVRIGTRVVVL